MVEEDMTKTDMPKQIVSQRSYAVKVRGRYVQPFRAPVIGPFPDLSFSNRT